jgi:uncharacterized protein
VRENGLELAISTGADAELVELFAVLHDSQRQNDGGDSDHGPRAAELAMILEGEFYRVGRERLKLLCEACRDHSEGYLEADITIQTCWDADRLDLGRIGIEPDPHQLCTVAAQDPEIIEGALRRSRTNHSSWDSDV